MNVLVTGGAGYIGSHTCVELLESGYGVVVIDNLCNSNPESLKRVQELTGKTLKFYQGDVRDEALLERIFAENDIGCVIHFAGLKAVGESVAMPWEYTVAEDEKISFFTPTCSITLVSTNVEFRLLS